MKLEKEGYRYGNHLESFWCSTCDRCDVEKACLNCKAVIKKPSGYKIEAEHIVDTNKKGGGDNERG